jgi:hypothetical protein
MFSILRFVSGLKWSVVAVWAATVVPLAWLAGEGREHRTATAMGMFCLVEIGGVLLLMIAFHPTFRAGVTTGRVPDEDLVSSATRVGLAQVVVPIVLALRL